MLVVSFFHFIDSNSNIRTITCYFIFLTAENWYDPCCSFPCQNQGVCLSKSNHQFTCDCTGLEYSGQTCETRKKSLVNYNFNQIRSIKFVFDNIIYSNYWFHIINHNDWCSCNNDGSLSYPISVSLCWMFQKLMMTASVTRRIKNWFHPSLKVMHKIYTGVPWLWKIVNKIPFLQNAIMRYVYSSESINIYVIGSTFSFFFFYPITVFLFSNNWIGRGSMVDTPPPYNTGYDYITTESHFNQSYYARSLPPVPKNCPTPMGVAGKFHLPAHRSMSSSTTNRLKLISRIFQHHLFGLGHKELPDVDYLAERFFKRRQFIAEPEGSSNVFFAFYAQHFSHQFFRKDQSKGPGFTMGKDGVSPFNVFLSSPYF